MSSLRLAVIATPLLFAVACGGYSAPSPTAPSPTAQSPAPTPSDPASSVTIPVGAEFLGTSAFMPAELTVAAGTTVTWVNTDRTTHTSTSDAAGWNSGNVAPGGQYSFPFQNAGTFQYHCAIHPGMVGTIVVR